MLHRGLALAVSIGVLVMVVPKTPGAYDRPGRAEAAVQQPVIAIPPSLQAEHHEIHEALLEATRVRGQVGAAAKELAAVLDPHFERENEIALPPPGRVSLRRITHRQAKFPQLVSRSAWPSGRGWRSPGRWASATQRREAVGWLCTGRNRVLCG